MKFLKLFSWPPSLPSATSPAKAEQWLIGGFATLVAIFAFLYSFFAQRHPAYDDTGLFNPIYMYFQHGKMSYPAHLYFDAMVVHPPVHYLEIALLMKAGLGVFRAAGVIVFLPTLLCLGLIVFSRFASPLKIALMAGLFCAEYVWGDFGIIRPEPQLAMVWFAGLLALESARIEGWNAKKLMLGSFLSVLAAGLHYWATPALLAPVIYAIWVSTTLGIRKAAKELLALAVGVGLFLIPYLLLFILPQWKAIRDVLAGVKATGGVIDAVQSHIANYHWLNRIQSPFWDIRRLTNSLTIPILATGIPAISIAAVIWLVVPGTRGVAIAGCILPLFVLLLVKRKAGTLYLLPEFILYIAGVIAAGLLLLQWLVNHVSPSKGWRFAFPVATFALAIGLLSQVPTSMGSQVAFSTQPPDQDWKVARAAGKEVIGSNALIASTTTVTWYTSGANYWYHIGGDLGYPQFQIKDRKAYLSQFDSIPVENSAWFVYGEKSLPLPFWYLAGELHLQGFYNSRDSHVLSLLYLSSKRPSTVVGYGYLQGQLYRFAEQPLGNHVYATLKCFVQDGPDAPFVVPKPTMKFPNFIYLDSPAVGARYLSTFVMEREQYEHDRATLAQGCTVRDEVIGQLEVVDKRPLLTQLKQEDKPIQFFQSLDQALAARRKDP